MKIKDWLAFAGLSLAWGSSFLGIKLALEEIGPFTLVAFRLLFGILGLLVVIAIQRPAWPRDSQALKALAVLGLTNTAIPFVLISWGEQFIDSAVAGIINAAVPLFTMVLAHYWLEDDKMTRIRVIALVVGFVGVAMLVVRDLISGVEASILGQGVVVLAVLFYSFSAVYIRKATPDVPRIFQAFGPLVVADVFIWSLVPFTESPLTVPQLPLTWGALAWLGLIGSCLAYLMYYYLIHSLGPTRATMVAYTFPVVGVALGVLVLDERLDGYLIAGTVFVLVSIWLVNRKPKAQAETSRA